MYPGASLCSGLTWLTKVFVPLDGGAIRASGVGLSPIDELQRELVVHGVDICQRQWRVFKMR